MALTLRERSIESVGVNQEQVVDVYSCPNSEMADQVSSLRGSTHGLYSGETAPVCLRASGKGHHYRDGEARIVAMYTTLDWARWLRLNVNKGIVFTSPATTAQSRKRDLDDKLIRGQDEDTAADKTWDVDEGEDSRMRPKESIVVRAVVDNKATYLDPFDGVIGYVAEPAANNIKVADAEHLLFLGKRVRPILDDDDLWEVHYHFIYHKLGWNDQCLCVQYERQQKKFPILGYYEPFGGEFGSGYAWKWLQQRTGETFYARLFPTADFSVINNMCA